MNRLSALLMIVLSLQCLSPTDSGFSSSSKVNAEIDIHYAQIIGDDTIGKKLEKIHLKESSTERANDGPVIHQTQSINNENSRKPASPDNRELHLDIDDKSFSPSNIHIGKTKSKDKISIRKLADLDAKDRAIFADVDIPQIISTKPMKGQDMNVPFVVGGFVVPFAVPEKCTCKAVPSNIPQVPKNYAAFFGYENIIRMKHYAYFDYWLGYLKKSELPLSDGWVISDISAALVHSKRTNDTTLTIYPNESFEEDGNDNSGETDSEQSAKIQHLDYDLWDEQKHINTICAALNNKEFCTPSPNNKSVQKFTEAFANSFKSYLPRFQMSLGIFDYRKYAFAEEKDSTLKDGIKIYRGRFQERSMRRLRRRLLMKNPRSLNSGEKVSSNQIDPKIKLSATDETESSNNSKRLKPVKVKRTSATEKGIGRKLPGNGAGSQNAKVEFQKVKSFHLLDEYDFSNLNVSGVSAGLTKNQINANSKPKTVPAAGSSSTYIERLAKWYISNLADYAKSSNKDGDSSSDMECKKIILKRLQTLSSSTSFSDMSWCVDTDSNSKAVKKLVRHAFQTYRVDLKLVKDRKLFNEILKIPSSSAAADGAEKPENPIEFSFFIIYMARFKFDMTGNIEFKSTSYFPKTKTYKSFESVKSFTLELTSAAGGVPDFIDGNPIEFFVQRSGHPEDSKACKNVIAGIKYGIYNALQQYTKIEIKKSEYMPVVRLESTNYDKNILVDGTKGEMDKILNEEKLENQDAEKFVFCTSARIRPSAGGKPDGQLNCNDFIDYLNRKSSSAGSGTIPNLKALFTLKRFYDLMHKCTSGCAPGIVSTEFVWTDPYTLLSKSILNVKVSIVSSVPNNEPVANDGSGNTAMKSKNIWYHELARGAIRADLAKNYGITEKICFSIVLTFDGIFRSSFNCFEKKSTSQNKEQKTAEYKQIFDPVITELTVYFRYIANIMSSQFTLQAVRANIESFFMLSEVASLPITRDLVLGLEMINLELGNALAFEITSKSTYEMPIQVQIQRSTSSLINVTIKIGTAQLIIIVPRIFLAKLTREDLSEILKSESIINYVNSLNDSTDPNSSQEPITDEAVKKFMEEVIKPKQVKYFKDNFIPVINGWKDKVFFDLKEIKEEDKRVLDEWADRGYEDSFMDVYDDFNQVNGKIFPPEKSNDLLLFQLNIYRFEYVLALINAVMTNINDKDSYILIELGPLLKPSDPSKPELFDSLGIDFEFYKGPKVQNLNGAQAEDDSVNPWLFNKDDEKSNDGQKPENSQLKTFENIAAAIKKLRDDFDFNHAMLTYGITNVKSETDGTSEVKPDQNKALNRKLRISLYELKAGPITLIHAMYTTQYFMWEYIHGFESYQMLWMQMNEAANEVLAQYSDLVKLDEKSFTNDYIDFDKISEQVSKKLTDSFSFEICVKSQNKDENNRVDYFYIHVNSIRAIKNSKEKPQITCNDSNTNSDEFFRIAQLSRQDMRDAKIAVSAKRNRYILRFYGLRLPKDQPPLDTRDQKLSTAYNSFTSHTYSFTATNFKNYDHQIEKYVEKAYKNMFQRFVPAKKMPQKDK